MAKTVITVTVDHHAATKALSRVLNLLDFCRNAYGITSLEYTVKEQD